MKKSVLKLVLALTAFFAVSTVSAQKKAWNEVKDPEITEISLGDNPAEISVKFNAFTNEAGMSGKVIMVSAAGKAEEAPFGKTRKDAKHAEFVPPASGVYKFHVVLEKKGEAVKKFSETKEFKFSLPLTETTVQLLNKGNGRIDASWTMVREAEKYVLSYTDASGAVKSIDAGQELFASITGLKAGTYSDISVAAVRGSESVASKSIHKLVKAEVEREWKFTEFGTSTKVGINTMEMIDPNDLKFTLKSCTYDPKTMNIQEKGGKFESFFDGISFYYTVIDPKKENFELTATVTVDYHNPMTDGQEGFGLLAIDRLGVDGQPMMIAYNNSAGLISRKFTTHINGSKKEIKNGVGARFVEGLTDELIAKGDAGIKASAISKNYAFSYDQSSDAVKTGDVYRVTLKKDNTGYHAIYKKEIESEGYKNTFTMYDNENVKLLQLDKDHIYLGFAVARGCNATFSDIELKITDPKKDPAPIPEPPTLVQLNTVIDCPTTWYDQKFPFVFTANCTGTITIKNGDKTLVKNEKIVVEQGLGKSTDYKKTIKLNKGSNDLEVTFDPDDSFKPAPKHAIGQWDDEAQELVEDYHSRTYTHSVYVKTFKGIKYDGMKDVLYVTPQGDVFGDGSEKAPLDLNTAIIYSKPGQTIVLKEGEYFMDKGLEIERGNNGTAKQRKTLIAERGKRAVINFSRAKVKVTAFNIFGDYWTIKNIDVTKSPDDVKAIQIGGSYNELWMVDTYLNGDTGIQIAGRSAEPFEKWPHDNLVYGCESFGNADPAQNNADGFASKLTSGNGNVFRNCVSHHNVDDGWDLYSKVETGPIGAVILDNCICYANGTKLDGTGKGDGNGFKLGGDGIPIKHVLRDSLSWGNGVNGVTCNSNPALILERVTVFGNGNYNISLYGKGKEETNPRMFQADGVLSFNGGAGDSYREMPSLAKDNNFFFNGAQTTNKAGTVLDAKDAFVNIDTSLYQLGYKEDGKTFNRIPRNEQGVFDLKGLFETTGKVPSGIGADYNKQIGNSNAK